MSELNPHDRDALQVFTGAIAGVIASGTAANVGLSGMWTTAVVFLIGATSVSLYRRFLSWTTNNEEKKENVNWPNWAS